MSQPDNSSEDKANANSRARAPRKAARFRDARAIEAHERRARLWWRLAIAFALLWWLGAALSDALLERWWLRDAQLSWGDGGLSTGGGASTWSDSGLDFALAHARLEAFRWGGSLVGALICGGWAWRQGRLAVANARESEASLGALWSVDEAGQPVLGGAPGGLEAHQTGRWIPLEDKLALDRFRPFVLRACIVGAALLGASLGGRAWPLWLDAWATRPLGVREPWLGQDLSFYLFRLPALDFAWRVLLLAHWTALALCVVIYLYEDSLQMGRRLWASARALRHLAILLALALAWKAVGALLFPFELLVQRSPSWSGPHAVDWLWRVPLNFASALFALFCAVACGRAGSRGKASVVLKWALAPVAASYVAINVLPVLRQAVMAPGDTSREDEPFARAQRDHTLLALGFSERTLPRHTASPSPVKRGSGVRNEEQSLARRELARALSDGDLLRWARPDDEREGEATAASVSISPPSETGTSAASTWAGASTLSWLRARQNWLEAATWEERHLDFAPSLAWERLAIEPRDAPGAADRAARLSARGSGQAPLLAGTDAVDSPGLLLDEEIAQALATGAAIEQARREAGEQNTRPDAKPAARPSLTVLARRSVPGVGERPASFFGGSFDGPAQAALSARHTLPLFRILHSEPGPAQAAAKSKASTVGVALDVAWKRWLAAWRFGSPEMARSPRVDEGARLAWRLDASQRCRRLAPFLSWPDAPRAILDSRGRLFWLLDGYTLSAAFPLARPLDTAGAFAISAPDASPTQLPARPPAPDAAPTDGVRRGTVTASTSGNSRTEEEIERRKMLVQSMIRREEILARLAANLDGFNWARASVAAIVEAKTGAVRLFPLHERDPILSLYRRALPELWSPPEQMPLFARLALRTPPHLALLQSAAWANATTPEASDKVWRASGYFLAPTPAGLRTGALLHQSHGSWSVAMSPIAMPASPAAPVDDEDAGAHWQAHIFTPDSPQAPLDWSRVEALAPIESSRDPQQWLFRLGPEQLNQDAPPNAIPDAMEAVSSATASPPNLSTSQSAPAWRRALELWHRVQAAKSRGDGAGTVALSRQLEHLLQQNTRAR